MPGVTKHGWRVLIVRRPVRFNPKAWDEKPQDAEVLCTAFPDLSRGAAVSWCRGFNEAELARPYGVWAVVKRYEIVSPVAAQPAANGHGLGEEEVL